MNRRQLLGASVILTVGAVARAGEPRAERRVTVALTHASAFEAPFVAHELVPGEELELQRRFGRVWVLRGAARLGNLTEAQLRRVAPAGAAAPRLPRAVLRRSWRNARERLEIEIELVG